MTELERLELVLRRTLAYFETAKISNPGRMFEVFLEELTEVNNDVNKANDRSDTTLG